MSLIASRFQRIGHPQTIQELDELMDLSFIGRSSNTGLRITETSLFQQDTAFTCINMISSDIARLPFNLMGPDGKGFPVPQEKHPLYPILKHRPNPLMTPQLFWKTHYTHRLGWGNAYAQIVRNRAGMVKELWPLAPDRMQVDFVNGKRAYLYRLENGEKKALRQEQVFHTMGISYDGIVGLSPVAHWMRETLGLSLALEKYGAVFFKNGARPLMLLKHPSFFKTKEEREEFKKNWHDAVGGLDNAHSLAVLEKGLEFANTVPLMPNNEAQFLEARRFQKEAIAQIYRVPRHMLQDMSQSIKANFTEQALDYAKYTLADPMIATEQAVQMQLLGADDINRGIFARHNMDALLRADIKTRYEAYREGINNGILKPNEAREKEDLPPDPAGDKLYIQGATVPLADAGKQQQPPSGAALSVTPKEVRANGALPS